MAVIEIELRAKDNASGVLNQAAGTFGKLVKSMGPDAAGALSTFGVNLTALNNPITALAQGLKSSIDFTTQWGDTIDEITRITGMGARESSKLAIVLGDVGISTDTLKRSARALKEQGLAPSLDTLKELAVQYQAIQDPAERNDFLFKKLGRSGLELSEFLSRDVKEIDALSAAAERSGKIIDEAGIQKAEQYKQKLAQLGDQVDGVKLSVGSFAVEILDRAIPAGQNYIGIWQALAVKAELATGMIDQNTASVKAAEIAGLSHADALKQVYAAEMKMTDSSDRLHESNTTLTATYAPLGAGAMDAAYWIGKDADAKERAISVTQDLATTQAVLAAGLSGVLGKAQEDYNFTVDDTQEKIDELTEKLARLGDTQGQTVTVVKNATVSQAELALAQDKVIVASDKLSAAQAKLSENTDPDKQFELQMSVNAATVAMENAQAKAFNLGGELGSLSTHTIDNTAKIAELHAELDPLIAKQEAAAAAAKLATDQFIYQQLSAGLDADAALTLAEKLGLIDPASANAARAAQELRQQYDDGKLSTDGFAGAAKNLADAVAALQSKDIQVTVNTIYYEERRQAGQFVPHEQGEGGMGGFQHGGSFTVPGSGSGDRPYLLNLEPGERVTVTPKSVVNNNGGNTYNYQGVQADMQAAYTRSLAGAF